MKNGGEAREKRKEDGVREGRIRSVQSKKSDDEMIRKEERRKEERYG